MFTRFFASRRSPPLVSADDLTRFLGEKTALVTQKTVIGYCYARTSLPLSELMRDQPFADAFERGRWLAYAAVLEDMFVIAEGRLRPAAAANGAELNAALSARFDRALADAAGAAVAAEARAAATGGMTARLNEARVVAPHSIADIAQTSGRRVYEAMPIHERHRRLDRESIIAGVRFLMVGMADEFDRRIDAPRIVADLLGSGAPDPVPPAR
jgi:hypothetical protein